MTNDNTGVPAKGVIPLDKMFGEDDEDAKLLRVMASGAKSFLLSFPWCDRISEAYYGDGYGGIVAIFLFNIYSTRTDVDEWLWVVFGDVPPAYLVVDSSRTPSQALERYLEEISAWVKLAKKGRSSKYVIPAYVQATPENAADVEQRMQFLQDIILPAFREAEAVRA
jgi:hypothetical protein